MFSIGWKKKFGYAVAELSRAKDRITFLEGQVMGLQSAVKHLRAKHTEQCLDINRLAGKIFVLEQHEAKREEAYRAQEDAYEERMRPSTNQDYAE